MPRSPILLFVSLPALALLLFPAPSAAESASLPQLGAPVPAWVVTSDKKPRECETGPDHRDPCAEVEINKIKFTVGWNAQTRNVTYIYTDDPHWLTDTQLAVGGSCSLVEPSGPDKSVRYMKWIIDPRWKDTDSKVSGPAVWYAAFHKDSMDPHYGDIVGFVQSRYLQLKQ